jgi:hypothetical protein
MQFVTLNDAGKLETVTPEGARELLNVPDLGPLEGRVSALEDRPATPAPPSAEPPFVHPEMEVKAGTAITINMDSGRPQRVNASRELTLTFETGAPNMQRPAVQVRVFGAQRVLCPQITNWANGVSEVKGPGELLVWRDFFGGREHWCGSWVRLEAVGAV